MSMTIALALSTSKDLKGEVRTLQARLASVTTWEEGVEPDFQFDAVLKEHDGVVEELVRLRAGIAIANSTTVVEFRGRSMTLAEAVLRMAEVKGRLVLFEGFSLKHGKERVRAGREYFDGRGAQAPEVVVHKAVMTEAERAAQLKELRKEARELSDFLSEVNSRTPVVLPP